MSEKKIYTRNEFSDHLQNEAEKMHSDGQLNNDALNLITKADKYSWIHQTTWFGEPILNLPQDMFAIQEIIFKSRPDYIIESGVAWGGSLLFYATLLEVLGGEKIIGLDIFIPEDLKERINSHKISNRIELLEVSSVEESTLGKVREIVGDNKKVMVILDSDHTHDHVLTELQLYSQLIGEGYYIICGDTIVENIPEQTHRPRSWGPGNNPKTALDAFLAENERFQLDEQIDNKLLLSCNPGGYLKCIKDPE